MYKNSNMYKTSMGAKDQKDIINNLMQVNAKIIKESLKSAFNLSLKLDKKDYNYFADELSIKFYLTEFLIQINNFNCVYYIEKANYIKQLQILCDFDYEDSCYLNLLKDEIFQNLINYSGSDNANITHYKQFEKLINAKLNK